MGWLSDRQIKGRCIRPTHFLKVSDCSNKWIPVVPGVTHPIDQVEQWEQRSFARLILATDKVLAEMNWKPLIAPFFDKPVAHNGKAAVMSYGVSSYGYDIRMSADDLKVFTNLNSDIVDPLNMQASAYTPPEVFTDEFDRKFFIQPPNSVSLGHSMEQFNVSRDMLITCLGKSTFARAGVSVIVTPLEPEWDGALVIEVVNHINSPVKVYLEMGIAQLLFGLGDETCEVSYADRKGKYQGQQGTQDALAGKVS